MQSRESSDHEPTLPAALIAARRFCVRESGARSDDPAVLAAALDAVCGPVLSSVRQSMGDDGCIALIGRAFARISWEHPASRTIRGPVDTHIPAANLSASIEAHGGTATAMAVDALLMALHEILGRIIGEDMSKRIIDHETPRSSTNGGASES